MPREDNITSSMLTGTRLSIRLQPDTCTAPLPMRYALWAILLWDLLLYRDHKFLNIDFTVVRNSMKYT
jgi:hypothetical protein